MKVLKKELIDLRWRFLFMIFLLLIVFLFVVYGRRYVVTSLPYDLHLLKDSFISKILNMDQLLKEINLMRESIRYYIWSQWYGKNFYQLILLSIILYGFSLFSRETERKTIYFLLSRVNRRVVFFSKVFAGTIFLLFTILIGGILPLFISFNLGLVGKIMLSSFITSLFLYMIVIFFSIYVNDDVKSVVFSILFFFILSIPGFFSGLSVFNIYRYMKGIDIYKAGNLPFLPLTFVFILSLILFWINWWTFRTKEF